MRPVLLRQMVKVLRVLVDKGGSAAFNELANALGVSEKRARELLKVLREMRLVDDRGNNIAVSSDGKNFLKAYEECDAETVNRFLFRLKPYSLVYPHYVNGVTKPIELRALTGLNIVVIDCIVRILREVEALKACAYKATKDMEKAKERESEMHREIDRELLPFVKEVISAYEEIARERRNRYVSIHELQIRVCQRLRMTVSEFNRLFLAFISRYREFVTLVPAPLYTTSVKTFDFDGKKYAYIMIDRRVQSNAKVKSIP